MKPVKVANSGAKSIPKIGKFCTKYDKSILFFVYIVAATLCVAQLSLLLIRFFDKPIGSSVKVQKSSILKVPSFVICPTFYKDLDDRDDDDDNDDETGVSRHQKNGNNTESIFNTFSNLRDNFNLSIGKRKFEEEVFEWWDQSKIGKAKFSLTNCKVAANREECWNGRSLIQEYLKRPTIFGGNCLKVAQVNSFYYTQRSKKVKFSFDGAPKIAAIAFYDDLTSVVYDLPFESELLKFKAKIVIENIKEFSYLNTKKHPCVSKEESIKCVDNAIDESLLGLDLCCLPFLNCERYKRNCSSIREIQSNMAKVEKLLLDGGIHFCNRSCEDSEIDFDVFSDDSSNSSVVTFVFENNIIEEIKEEYTYELSALTSDIVGNLGFFVGISLVTIISKPVIMLKNRLVD